MDKPRILERTLDRYRDRRELRRLGRQAFADLSTRMEKPSHARRLSENPTVVFQEPHVSPRAMQLLQGRENVDLGGGRTLLCIDEDGVAHIQADTRHS